MVARLVAHASADKEGNVSLDLFREKGVRLDKQVFDWKDRTARGGTLGEDVRPPALLETELPHPRTDLPDDGRRDQGT